MVLILNQFFKIGWRMVGYRMVGYRMVGYRNINSNAGTLSLRERRLLFTKCVNNNICTQIAKYSDLAPKRLSRAAFGINIPVTYPKVVDSWKEKNEYWWNKIML